MEDLDADSGSENGIATPKLFVDRSGLPEAALLDEELHDVMEDAIAALPPDLRIVFIWRDLEGLSTAETAEVVGISVANVKVRLHRDGRRCANNFPPISPDGSRSHETSP